MATPIEVKDATEEELVYKKTRHGVQLRPREWYRQRFLKRMYKDEDVPDLDEIESIIAGIGVITKQKQEFHTKRARALVAMYYLTACRVSEFIKVKRLFKQRIKKEVSFTEEGTRTVKYILDSNGQPLVEKFIVKHEYMGIRKCDIKFLDVEGRRCMLIRTENRKHKTRLTKRLPIPVEKEWRIVQFVLDYLDELDIQEPLFDFSKTNASKIINNTVGWNPHFIRHIRATHLITLYDFNEQALVRFMGWTDSRPAKCYVELSSKDVFRQFYKLDLMSPNPKLQ